MKMMTGAMLCVVSTLSLASVASAQNLFQPATGIGKKSEHAVADTQAEPDADGYVVDGQPPLGYFTGVYQMIGRDDYAKPIDRLVKIEPRGRHLQVTACDGAFRYEMAFTTEGEVKSIFETVGENPIDMMYCPFFNNAGNYPIFTCMGAEYTRLTLWPYPDYELEGCAG